MSISKGIKQGDCLSPARNVGMGQTEFEIFCYTDDAVNKAKNEENQQSMLF